MSKFEDNLYDAITEKNSAKLLNDYLTKRSGRYFELFKPHEKKPNEITPSDLLAVSQLSMKIGGYQKGDSIPDSAVIKLFNKELQKKVSKSLTKIKSTFGNSLSVKSKTLKSILGKVILFDSIILSTISPPI